MRRLRAWLVAAWLAALALAAPAWAQADVESPEAASHKVLVLVRIPLDHYRPGAQYGAGYNDANGRRAQRRLADRIAHDHRLTIVDDWPMPLLQLDCFIMAVPADQSVETAAQALARDPGVAWSEPMHLYHAQGSARSPNDPLFPVQPAAHAWRLDELHQVATGRGVTVAVIDSQVETNHPDLAGQVPVSENFAPAPAHGAEQHGTAIAGVIAAKANNGVGIVGVAPQARLMALRACWQLGAGRTLSTVCDSVSLAKALHFGIERRAQVINLSLSGPPDMLVSRLIDVALARGETVVAAYDPKLPHGGFPASHPGVISVADQALATAPPGVYAAPGRDVPTTEPGGRWSLVDGSSYAAAHVSGLEALLRERGKGQRGAIRLVAAKASGGRVEACATLLGTSPTCDCVCVAPQEKLASVTH